MINDKGRNGRDDNDDIVTKRDDPPPPSDRNDRNDDLFCKIATRRIRSARPGGHRRQSRSLSRRPARRFQD